MADSYKQGKLLTVVQEFVVEGDRYNINGIIPSEVVFFARTNQNMFRPIPKGNYKVVTEGNILYLIILNQDYLKTIERIQICKEFVSISSEYEVDFDIDISTLKDRYNELVVDVKNMFQYVKKTMMIADGEDVAVVLPQLDTDEVWVKTNDGYRGLNIGSLEANIQELIDQFKALVVSSKQEITQQTVEAVATITSVTELNKEDIEKFTETKINELQQEGYKQKEDIIEQGNIDLARVTAEGDKQVKAVRDKGDEVIAEIEGMTPDNLNARVTDLENNKVSKSGDTMTGDLEMGDGHSFIGSHNFGYRCKGKDGEPFYSMYVNAYDKLCFGFDDKKAISFQTTDLTCLNGQVWNEGNFNPNLKQDKTDNSLETTSKNTTGAINELNKLSIRSRSGVKRNLNEVLEPGLYHVYNDGTGSDLYFPYEGLAYGYIEVYTNSGERHNNENNWIWQFYRDTYDRRSWRHKVNGADWSPWFTEWSSRNFNPDTKEDKPEVTKGGNYTCIKYKDGRMILTVTVKDTETPNKTTINFPVGFSAPPTVTFTVDFYTEDEVPALANVWSVSNNGFNLLLSRTIRYYHYVAYGFWK